MTPADHICDDVYVGGNTAAVPEVPFWYLLNVCPTAHSDGERTINRPFGDTILHGPVLEAAEGAFRSAMRARATGAALVVRCQMGLNRSALIAAGVLIAEGHIPFTAVEAVREARGPDALLFNRSFENFLLNGGFTPFTGERVWYQGSQLKHHGPALVTDAYVFDTATGEHRMDIHTATGRMLEQVRASSVLRGRPARQVIEAREAAL